jgi:xanthine dehydrogenase YagT iron-sulfur-binding subunit
MSTQRQRYQSVHEIAVRFTLNGRSRSASVRPRVTLLDWLREEAGLTGTKKGCNEGACGTCTVLIDGQRMSACMILLVQCEGSSVTTIEGIASPDGTLHPLQRTFIEHDAFQCGYCTPGQIVSGVACIAEGHATDEATVREWMSGNVCRCSRYPQITAAVLDAASAHPGKGNGCWGAQGVLRENPCRDGLVGGESGIRTHGTF